MNKLSDKEKKLLFVLFIMIIMVICTRMVLMPNLEGYNALKTEVQTGKNQLVELKGRLLEGENIDTSIEDIKNKVEKASKPFFPVSSEEKIQKWLVKEAEKAGLQVTALTISKPTTVVVTPYAVEIVENIQDTYPIGQLFGQLKNQLEEEVTASKETEKTQETESAQTEVIDQVLKTTIEMTFTGDEKSLMRFLNQVKEMKRYLMIENIPLNSLKEGNTSANMTLSMYSIHKNGDNLF